MTRVSTAGSFALMLNNLQAAQQRQNEAGIQVSSQKKAQDFKGFAGQAEVLTAMRGVSSKVEGFIGQNDLLIAKLEIQAGGLEQVSTSAIGAREAIANALASENGDTLMQELQGFFVDAISGLNTRHNGQYLFSGGKVDNKPVTATNMSDLTAVADVADLFANDQYKAVARVDENSTVQTGFLAADIGTGLFDALRQIQDYVDNNGSFSSHMTQAQHDFLAGVLSSFDDAYDDLTAVEGSNGVIQNQVDNTQGDLGKRQDMLQVMVGNIVDADVTEAVSNLQAAQLSLQASAHVFSTLKQSSLLDILR